MSNKITLIRKQAEPFSVNYPFQLTEGGQPHFDWQGSKGSVLSKREVPIEVFEWLRDYTNTFKSGMLIVDENEDKTEEVLETIETTKIEQENINKAILTRSEIEQMLTSGNQNVLKKKLNELVEDLDEYQAQEIKGYIYREAIDIGVDSMAKRKDICDWYGTNVEDCGYIFDKEEK